MRSVIVVACLMGLVATASVAAPTKAKEKPKTILEQVQGKWVRKNHEFSFFITGNRWTEFSENKMGTPHATGAIEIRPGKEYAIVKADNGATFWLFPSGENVLAVETVLKDGSIVGAGRVFYRPDFTP